MKRRKSRPRKSRVHAKHQEATQAPSALVDAAVEYTTACIVLKTAIDDARKGRRKKMSLQSLVLKDPAVLVAFRAHVDALVRVVEATGAPAVGSEERERPVAEAAPDPRRVPIRSHEAEEPEEDEDE